MSQTPKEILSSQLEEQYNDWIELNEEWLTEEDAKLKLLIVLVVLAQEKLGFRGKYSDLCQWLGIRASTENTKRLKIIASELEQEGKLEIKKISETISLMTISEKAYNQASSKRIRKAWIETMRDYNSNRAEGDKTVNWLNILRVFVYVYNREDKRKVFTHKEIGSVYGLSTVTVGSAAYGFSQCKFEGIITDKHIMKEPYLDKDGKPQIKTLGTEYDMGIIFKD